MTDTDDIQTDDTVDLSNPVARAVVSTEKPETQPQFAPTADPEETVGRVREFVRQHAIAGRPFDTMSANYKKVYPDFDPPSKDDYQSWVDQAPQQVRLDNARQTLYQQVQGGQGPSGLTPQGFLLRRAVSFPRDVLTSAVYTNAKANMRQGTAEDADYRNIALYEHEQGLDAAQTQGMKVAGLFAGLPSQMAGMELGGALARPIGAAVGEGLGLGARGTAALQMTGQAVLAPNLAAQTAIHQNLEAGREPWDIRGVASGTALSIAQIAVMHQVGKLTEGAFPGSGPATAAVGRFVSQGSMGPFSQQLADIAGYTLGLQTRAGALQDFLDGKKGEAGQKIVQDALTYGGFGVLQGNPEAGRNVADAVRDSINANMRRGVSARTAADSVPDVGGIIDRLRQDNPNPTRADVQSAFDQAGIADHPVAKAVAETFPETIQAGAQNGPPPENAPGQAVPPEAQTPAEGGEVAPGTTPAHPPAENPPVQATETARQRADALEQQHLDLTGQLNDARQTEARLKSELGMGVGRPEELAEAKQLRVGLERQLRRMERDLDTARSQAAVDEVRRRSQGVNVESPGGRSGGPNVPGVERRQAGRPPQGVWDAIKSENPDWTVEQIGREAARRADQLMVDPQTGLKSRAQYAGDAAAHGKHTSIYDVPSMHEVNNQFGDQAGDALLAAHGAAMREAGIERGYRKGGDELAALFDSPEDQQTKSAKYQDILNNTVVTWEDANGAKVSVKGFGAAVSHGDTPQQAQARLPAAKEAASAAGFRSRGPGQLPPGLTIETSGGRPSAGVEPQRPGSPQLPPAQRQDVQGGGRTAEPLTRLHKQLLVAIGDATEEGGNLVGKVRDWQKRHGQPPASASDIKAAREELRSRGVLQSAELTPEQHEQLGRQLPGLRLEIAQLDKAMLAGELPPTKANKGLLRLLRGNLAASEAAHAAGPGEYWFRSDEPNENVPSPDEVEQAKQLIRQERASRERSQLSQPGAGESAPVRRARKPLLRSASDAGGPAPPLEGTGPPAAAHAQAPSPVAGDQAASNKLARTDLLPPGWTMAVDSGVERAEVDYANKRLLFRTHADLNNPKTVNHEIAHVAAERLLEGDQRGQFLKDYASLKADDPLWKKYGADWIVKNGYHHEHLAVDLGEHLSGGKVSPELAKMFDRYLPQPAAEAGGSQTTSNKLTHPNITPNTEADKIYQKLAARVGKAKADALVDDAASTYKNLAGGKVGAFAGDQGISKTKLADAIDRAFGKMTTGERARLLKTGQWELPERIEGAMPRLDADIGNRLVGKDTAIATPDGGSVPARYEVRELGDVRASHQVLPNGALRSRVQAGEYPANLQPRDYAASGEQQKVGRIASGMVPSMLVTNHPAASEGPPTITRDGTVLNGNGRQMGLERAAGIGTFDRYKSELIRQAESFGLDPKAIEKMQRPVLYRSVDMDPRGDEARQFAAAGNVSMTQSQSPVRTAASLSRLVTPELIDSLKLEGDKTFSEAVTDPKNGKAFRDRLRGELPPQEVSRFFHEDGRLTDAGTELVRSMLLAKVLPTELIERMGEEMKGLKRTIEGAIPQLVQVMRDFPAAHVGPQLVEALNVMARNPKMRTPAEADTVLSQGSLFGGKAEEVSPGGRMLLDFLLNDGQKPLVFRRKLGAFVDDLAGQGGLYGDSYPDTVTMAAEALGVKPREGAAFGDIEGAVDELNDAKRDAQRAGFAPQALEEVSRREQAAGLAEGGARPQAAPGPENGNAGGPETPGSKAGGPQYFLGGGRGRSGQPGGRGAGGPSGPAGQPGTGLAGTAGPGPGRQPVPSGVDLLPAARGSLREVGAERQRRYDIVKAKIGAASRDFDDMVRSAGQDKAKLWQQFLDWTNPGESGQIAAMPAGPLKDAAQAVRDLYDERQPELQRLGLVKNFIDNYLGHLWKDPQNPSATPEELAGRINARRSFAGPEGFRKERTLPTFEDGFNAGLEPMTWNPIEMQMLRLREVDKSITAHTNFEEMKDKGAFKYFGLGQRLPNDWAFFSDKMGKVFAPPQTPVKEFFDKQQMDGLEKFAAKLGINVRTLMKGTDIAKAGQMGGLGAPPGRASNILGASMPGEVMRRFGTPEEILAHEIGHQLDAKYNLRAWSQNPVLRPELEALADLRASGRVSPQMQQYLRSPAEQIANLTAAYLHAPELLKRVAPNAAQAFDSFLSSHRETAPLRDIKPGLEIGEREQMMRLAGPMLVGNYAGPKEVMQLYDRFLSPGLGGSGLYRGIRGAANTVNQFNLGLSAWHATGVALNSTFSSIALGLKKMSRGDFAEGVGDILSSPIAPFRDFLGGRSGKAEWLAPGTQGAAMADDIQRVVESGGRVGMDSMDNTRHLQAIRNALEELKAGNIGTAVKDSWAGTRLVPALAEMLNKPTMDIWVPQVKLGAAMRALRYEADSALRRGMPMDVDARRQAFGKIWDSMDDRFGQLVYDNLFWHRTVKDAATAAVRAVGWNVGTIRAYGGAVKDIPSSASGLLKGEGISDRLAFGVASVFGSALVGAMTQYLLTGKGPNNLTDLAYPKTGKTNRDGTEERLSFPTYLDHDIAPLFNRSDEGPFRWVESALGAIPGKLNPLLTVPWEAFAKNEDWRGAAIRDPNDPIVQQTKDVFGYLVRSLLPFSVENAMNASRRGQPAEQIAGSFFGVTPAGYKAEHSAEQQRQAESGRKVELTPLQKRLRQQ